MDLEVVGLLEGEEVAGIGLQEAGIGFFALLPGVRTVIRPAEAQVEVGDADRLSGFAAQGCILRSKLKTLLSILPRLRVTVNHSG